MHYLKYKNLKMLILINEFQISGECFPLGQERTNFPVFGRIIERLVFQLDKVFPMSALEAG